MRSYIVKENHIGAAVSEILLYTVIQLLYYKDIFSQIYLFQKPWVYSNVIRLGCKFQSASSQYIITLTLF